MSPWKTILIVSTVILGILVASAVLIPLIFEDRIVEQAHAALNEKLDATVTLSDVDVSLISSFPTLTATINDLTIVGIDAFEGVTLFEAKSVSAGLGLVALIFDRSIEIESVEIDQPNLHLVVDEAGRGNYDIVRDTAEDAGEPEPESGDLRVEIKRYRISDGSVSYEQSGMRVIVAGLEHDGRATISGSTQELSSRTRIDALTVRLGRISYLKNARLALLVTATVDVQEENLRLEAFDLTVNDLALQGAGDIRWSGEGTDLDLQLASGEGLSVKALISAIPGAYAADFAGLEASGRFSIAAALQGQLGPEDHDIPSFSATANVRDVAFKYPDFPLGVSDFNLDAKVTHPGGNLDEMRVEVPAYGVRAGKSHANGHLTLAHPLSQRQLDLALDGRFDIAEIGKAYPIADLDALRGLVVAKIALSAKGERIETLSGSIDVGDMHYQPAGAPSIFIRSARMELTPKATKVVGFDAQVAQSDLRLSGVASPITAFLDEDQLITAKARLQSKRLRVEDFLGTEKAEAEGGGEPFLLPDGIDAKLALDVAKLTYGDLVLENFKGTGRLRNRTLILDGVRTNALGGSMRLNGTIATPLDEPATFDIDYAVQKARFADAFEMLPSVRAYAPMARFLDGRFSTELHAKGTLDESLSPKIDSIDARGLVAALQSKLSSDFKPLAALNDAVPAIPDPLDIEGVEARFEIDDGAVRLKPSTVEARGVTLQVSGSHGLDQDMRYQLTSEIPVERLSSKLAQEAKALRLDLSKAKTVGVRALLTGSIKAPRVTAAIDTEALRAAIADAISAEVDEQRERALREAAEQASRLVEEAEERAAQIRAEAEKGADKLREEGYARAAQLEKEGSGNPISAAAARQGAKRIRSEADKRADQLVAEADKRAAQGVAEARKRADQLLSEAARRSEQGAGALETQTGRIR
jgi:hypothetical protein